VSGRNWVAPLVASRSILTSVPLAVAQLTKASVDTITTEILIKSVCLLSANDRENVPITFLAMRLPAASIMGEQGKSPDNQVGRLSNSTSLGYLPGQRLRKFTLQHPEASLNVLMKQTDAGRCQMMHCPALQAKSRRLSIGKRRELKLK
jgi:hypothetical protein